MKKAVLWLCLILFIGGCSVPVKVPLPEDHPAYGFYQTANAFNVSIRECGKLKGSLEIRPDKIGSGRDYEKIREFAPGLFLVKQKATGKESVTVIFMEYGLVTSIPKACSWDLNDYPINKDIKT